MNQEFKDPKQAFEQAIQEGRLSRDPGACNYAGKYMYMGPTVDGLHDAFKHIDTRRYLPIEPVQPTHKFVLDSYMQSFVCDCGAVQARP